MEGVCVTIGNPAFCLFLYLTGVHFRGKLQHIGDVSQQKIKCRPIRTREIGGVTLSDILYENIRTYLMGRLFHNITTFCHNKKLNKIQQSVMISLRMETPKQCVKSVQS